MTKKRFHLLPLLLAGLLCACGPKVKLPPKARMVEALDAFQQNNLSGNGVRKVHVEDALFQPMQQPDGSVRITYTAMLVIDEPWVVEVSRNEFLKAQGFPADELQAVVSEVQQRNTIVAKTLLSHLPQSTGLEPYQLLKIETPQGHRVPFRGEFRMQLYPDGGWQWSDVQAQGESWKGRPRSEFRGEKGRWIDAPELAKIAAVATANARRWMEFANRRIEFQDSATQPWPTRGGDRYVGVWDDGKEKKTLEVRVDSMVPRTGDLFFILNDSERTHAGRLAVIGTSAAGVARPVLLTFQSSDEEVRANAASDPLFPLFARQLWTLTPDGKTLTGYSVGEKAELQRVR